MTATFATLRPGETVTLETNGIDQSGAPATEAALGWAAGSEPYQGSVTVTAPAVTTAVADALIVLIGHVAGTGTAGVFSGSPTPTERLDDTTTLGSDAAIFADTFPLSVAGTTSSRTATYSTAVRSVGATVAIESDGTPPTFSSVGTVAKVASGNMTPGEPSGATTGDILLCIIEQRDNVVATMSSDWTNVYSFNHLRFAPSFLSRVSLFWCRRTGSAPSYLITRASGDAGIAAVLRISNGVATGSPIHRVACSSHISVVETALAAESATVVGNFPGSDTIVYDWGDPFTLVSQTVQAVTVIDATRIGFSTPTLVFDDDSGIALDPVTVAAYGLDVRADAPNPPYVLTDCTWVIQGSGKISFTGASTGTVVEIQADGNGSDSIVVTAKNQQGQTITGTLPVVVKSVVSVSLAIA